MQSLNLSFLDEVEGQGQAPHHHNREVERRHEHGTNGAETSSSFGDKPAPNKIEFEGLAQGVGVKYRDGRFSALVGQPALNIKVQRR